MKRFFVRAVLTVTIRLLQFVHKIQSSEDDILWIERFCLIVQHLDLLKRTYGDAKLFAAIRVET